MADFIETPRFPESISYGTAGGPTGQTKVKKVRSGAEKRAVIWNEQIGVWNAAHAVKTQGQISTLINWFRAMEARAVGFRFKDWLDYASVDIPDSHQPSVSGTDQNIGTGDGTTTAFQLRKQYIVGAQTINRDILKPVTGTVAIAIGGVVDGGNWSVDTTTGIVTFDADASVSVTNAVDQGGGVTRITAASHTLLTGETVHLSAFTGDWAGLNGNRYAVTRIDASNFDITHDSSTYTAYSSNGGTTHTLPQTPEAITAGYEFDVPVRFDTDALRVTMRDFNDNTANIPIIELLEP